MCRSILELRGLEPPATDDEVAAAARQFVRKVTGIRRPTGDAVEPFEAAVGDITTIVAELLQVLPARRQPPRKVPPNRLVEGRTP